MIDPEGAEPIHLQLAAIIRVQIQDGTLPPNRPVPSIAMLVQTYGVDGGTAIHALEILRNEGLVHTVQGRGTFVK